MNIRVPQKAGNFLSSSATVSFCQEGFYSVELLVNGSEFLTTLYQLQRLFSVEYCHVWWDW